MDWDYENRRRVTNPNQGHTIPHQEWPEFFQGFSRKHMGWLVTVEVLDPAIGSQMVARDFSLKGVAVDSKRLGEGALSIFLSKKGDENLTHTVTSPTEIRLKRSEEGADEALEIRSTEGPITLLRFRTAIPSEEVDGIPP